MSGVLVSQNGASSTELTWQRATFATLVQNARVVSLLAQTRASIGLCPHPIPRQTKTEQAFGRQIDLSQVSR